MKIKSINKIKNEKVYDLEIEDNHNFFANNVLVHNCVRATMKRLGKSDKKQKDIDDWNNYVKAFVDGALKLGIKKEDSEKVAEDLLKLSGYFFNKSHSVAYTYNAIITLYLTVYFRIYYYAATLTYLNQNKKEEIFNAIIKMKQHDIQVLPPDINISNKEFTPVSNKEIRFGLMNIKFLGDIPAETIIQNRPYKSFFDFIIKTVKPKNGINERVLRGLVSTGCFDCFDINRKKLIFILGEFFERKKTIKVEEKLLALCQSIEKEADVLNFKTTQFDYIDYEKEFFDYNFFHGYFTDSLKERLYKAQRKGLIDLGFEELYNGVTKRIPVIINSLKSHIDKNKNEMVFVEFEDMFGRKESMPIFASMYKSVKDILKNNSIYLVYFYLTAEADEKVMFGRNIWLDTDEQKKGLIKELILKE